MGQSGLTGPNGLISSIAWEWLEETCVNLFCTDIQKCVFQVHGDIELEAT